VEEEKHKGLRTFLLKKRKELYQLMPHSIKLTIREENCTFYLLKQNLQPNLKSKPLSKSVKRGVKLEELQKVKSQKVKKKKKNKVNSKKTRPPF
jgi:hypothetical protein